MGAKDQMRWRSLCLVRNQTRPKCELIRNGGTTDMTILVMLCLMSLSQRYLYLALVCSCRFVLCIDDIYRPDGQPLRVGTQVGEFHMAVLSSYMLRDSIGTI